MCRSAIIGSVIFISVHSLGINLLVHRTTYSSPLGVGIGKSDFRIQQLREPYIGRRNQGKVTAILCRHTVVHDAAVAAAACGSRVQ